MSLRDKLKAAIQKKLSPEELLKYLCPFELEFKLKIFANRNNHDYVILIQVKEEGFIEDPRDLQTIVSQLASQSENWDVEIKKARYEDEVYLAVYLDIKKEGTKEG